MQDEDALMTILKTIIDETTKRMGIYERTGKGSGVTRNTSHDWLVVSMIKEGLALAIGTRQYL